MSPGRPPADPLCVIDRLEVGPVTLEPERLVTPYVVHRGGQRSSTELVYRYQEGVFAPGSDADLNLASMIGAQVALNYGLFCRELVFHGPFDAHDQRFLTDYLENTAREIYVKKFLEPNPFLVPEIAERLTAPRDRYAQTSVVFPTGVPAAAVPQQRWQVDHAQHAVLSSGGKDSLLTFGLLREMQRSAHALFVNESGRHWYTALNGYRHLLRTDPATARVWTNSDRLFTWMLRHLPFVRSDFARVRADEYPIRLWTVAVFLFGVLPLMRRRGLGRLLIGDEFDTTVERRTRGIRHYDGLFDQGRLFDNALSRYFTAKGWDISQFSVLRPCSELLIEKVLVERYPDLQAHQVSCHATHLRDGRVYPCGRCEKCRRVMGMLVAVGADPTRCGYEAAQVEAGLAAIVAEGVHQESAGARMLVHLLRAQGHLPPLADEQETRPPHPEVLQLRFHAKRSPIDGIPPDLRKPLYRLLLKHADGAVLWEGGRWVPCDPLSEQMLGAPYPFERPTGAGRGPDSDGRRVGRGDGGPAGGARADEGGDGGGALGGDGGRDRDRSESGRPPFPYLLGELTWPQAERCFKEVDIALLPVGSIEQHGRHLPLDTDAWDADYLARRVAAACSHPRPLVLPLIPYGVSYHHDDFPGTLSISPTTLAQVVHDVGMAAARNGITKLVIINGHGGNAPALNLAAQTINRDARIFTCVDSGESSDTDIDELAETPNDVHAGEIETSTSLAVRPELVQMRFAKKMVPRFSSRFLEFSSKRSVAWYARTARISRTGVMGDATRATREKGEQMWEVMTRRLVELIEDLKRMTLDEIYQRRY